MDRRGFLLLTVAVVEVDAVGEGEDWACVCWACAACACASWDELRSVCAALATASTPMPAAAWVLACEYDAGAGASGRGVLELIV